MEPEDESERRLFEILETIQALARFEFAKTARVGPEGDLFDALAAGVNMLGEELLAFQRQVDERAKALSVANAELTRRAHYDSLTGLANRALFWDRLTQALAGEAADDSCVAVMAIDLDGFKQINDSLGHEAGDLMLIEVGRRLEAVSTSRHTAARVGGDEFCVLMTDGSESTAARFAAELATRLAEPFHVRGEDVRVSAGIGIALGGPGRDPEELMRNADVALYESKASPTNKPQVYVPGMHDPIVHRLRLSSALRGAVERVELSLAYQPIVDLGTRSIVGFEALARWHHPELGSVPPSVFIPLAERIGIMPQLGGWVLGVACEEAAHWPRGDGSSARPYVSVNLSAGQLQEDRLPELIDEHLHRSGLPADQLMFEVTESQMVEHMAEAVQVLGALRSRGARVAIDDFGTGYSSLSYLRRLPLDVVKIDRAFVASIGTDPKEWAFAQAIVRLIHRLGLVAVAEGVEDAAQLAHARATGCEMAQGYYFGRPGDAASARALLAPQAITAAAGQRAARGGTRQRRLVAAPAGTSAIS